MAASPPLGPEVGAERSSDGEVARTPELRRPGRARPWSAARALALPHPPSPLSRGSLAGLPLLEKGPFDTKEIASVPPFTNHYLNPRRMVGSWLS